MRRAFALSALIMSLTSLSAFADDDRRRGGWGRFGDDDDNRRRDSYRYEDRRYRGGRSGDRDGFGVVNQTLSDLRRAASRNRVDSHERDHFERAMRELQAFQYSYSSGRFEEGRLDRAMDDLRDLARADQVHPSDRRVLGRDLQQLRVLRDTRGGYARRY